MLWQCEKDMLLLLSFKNKCSNEKKMWLPTSGFDSFIVLAEWHKEAQAEIKLFYIKYTNMGMNEGFHGGLHDLPKVTWKSVGEIGN